MNKTNFKKVIDFNNCAGHPVYDSPQKNIFNEKPDRVDLRLKLIEEEVKELKEAIQNKDFTETIDALSDILYVVYGAGAEFGIDLDKSFDLVHESNMTKFCKTEDEAKKTVENYKKNVSRYKNPQYRKSPDDTHWVVYDKDTDKALKSINYTPVSFNNM
jgi:predicted HAD superfamily Cof-like phosphohydrolase